MGKVLGTHVKGWYTNKTSEGSSIHCIYERPYCNCVYMYMYMYCTIVIGLLLWRQTNHYFQIQLGIYPTKHSMQSYTCLPTTIASIITLTMNKPQDNPYLFCSKSFCSSRFSDGFSSVPFWDWDGTEIIPAIPVDRNILRASTNWFKMQHVVSTKQTNGYSQGKCYLVYNKDSSGDLCIETTRKLSLTIHKTVVVASDILVE